MRARYALAASLTVTAMTLLPALSLAREAGDAIKACRKISDDSARLSCFDTAARSLEAPTFEGRLSLLTEPFKLSGPAKLRFQSDGPIFVLYLKSADGTVLQNLHIGGGGEDSYRISQGGTYRLQINGSETWRVWLEPEPTETN